MSQLISAVGLGQPRSRRIHQGQALQRREPRFPLGEHGHRVQTLTTRYDTITPHEGNGRLGVAER
ncbi:MAG: hypothetical protein ACREX8_07470 [Gammaproteobacteria bacterium]